MTGLLPLMMPGHFDDETFDMVFCVGNSLHHAVGARGRVAALESMSRLLRRGGRLVLTSRMWELVRARGSRLDISDRLVSRDGRDAVVVYRWEIPPSWEDEHHIEIAIAHVDPAGSVLAREQGTDNGFSVARLCPRVLARGSGSLVGDCSGTNTLDGRVGGQQPKDDRPTKSKDGPQVGEDGRHARPHRL